MNDMEHNRNNISCSGPVVRVRKHILPRLLKLMRDKFAAWRKEMDETEPRGPFRDY